MQKTNGQAAVSLGVREPSTHRGSYLSPTKLRGNLDRFQGLPVIAQAADFMRLREEERWGKGEDAPHGPLGGSQREKGEEKQREKDRHRGRKMQPHLLVFLAFKMLTSAIVLNPQT